MNTAELLGAITLAVLTALLSVVRLIGLRLKADLERVERSTEHVVRNTNGLISDLKRSLDVAISENEALRLENAKLRAIIGGRRKTDTDNEKE